MRSRFIVPSAAAIGLGLASSALACDGKSGGESSSPAVSSVVSLGAVAATDGAESFEIRISNGKASAKVNGQPVPEDRIRLEEKRVVILDEKGDVLREVPMMIMGDDDAMMQLFIGDESDVYTTQPFGAAQMGPQLRQQLQALVGRMPQHGLARVGPSGGGAWPFNDAEEPPKVMMGVVMATPDEALAVHLKVDPATVTMVAEVEPELPASKAGLQRFDIITKVNGKSPAGPDAIREALQSANPGDELKVDVVRGGETKSFTISLAAFDPEKFSSISAEAAPADVMGSYWAPRALNQVRPLKPAPAQGAPRGSAPPAPSAPRMPVPPGAPGSPDPIGPDDHMLFVDPGQFFNAFGAPPDPAMQERLDEMNRRLDEMSRRLEKLMEQLEKRSN